MDITSSRSRKALLREETKLRFRHGVAIMQDFFLWRARGDSRAGHRSAWRQSGHRAASDGPGLLQGVVSAAQAGHGAGEAVEFAAARGQARGAADFDGDFGGDAAGWRRE